MGRLASLAFVLVGVCASSEISLAADDIKPGLIAEYFDMEKPLDAMPTVPEDKKPSIKRVDKLVNADDGAEYFNGTNLTDHFYVRWTGSVKIEKVGKYVFGVISDDGSRLFVDGKQVVDNPGLHPMEKKTGEIELTAGQHEIKLEYFQNEGGSGCKLLWIKPGAGEEVIPEESLWHKVDAER